MRVWGWRKGWMEGGARTGVVDDIDEVGVVALEPFTAFSLGAAELAVL